MRSYYGFGRPSYGGGNRIVFRNTLTGLRVSTVAGVALIDSGTGVSIVTNGGFDSSTTGWTPQNSTIASVAGGQAGNCLELTVSGGATQTFYQTDGVTTTIGEVYTLLVWVKSGTSGNEGFTIVVTNNEWNTIAYVSGVSSGTWTRHTLNFTATSALTNFLVRKDTSTAGTMLFDTVGIGKWPIPYYADGNHSIEIYASGLLLKGVLKEAGSAETLGVEKFTDTTLTNTTPWIESGFEITAGGAVASADNQYSVVREEIAGMNLGMLFKNVFTISSYTSGSVRALFNSFYGARRTSADTFTDYGTTLGDGLTFGYKCQDDANNTLTINAASLKQVTAPSTSGCVIESVRGAADGNWGTNQWVAGSYNLASYQVIVRAIR